MKMKSPQWSEPLVRLAILVCLAGIVATPVFAQAPNPGDGEAVPAAEPLAVVGPFGIFVPGPSPVPPFTGTTINFEGFAEGTLIDIQFAGLGVTFTQDDGGTPMIDNKSFLFAFESGSGVGVLTGSTNGGAPFPTVAGLVADFSPAVSRAGAFMSDTAPLGTYTITIFNSGGGTIDTITVVPADFPITSDPACDGSSPWDGTGCGVFVGFDTGVNNIAKIQFGPSAASGDAFSIDDLVFAADEDVLEPKLDVIEVKLDELKPEVVDLKAEVADLKAETADIKAEITDTKAELTDVKAEITDLKAETVDIRNQQTIIQTQISDVKAEVVDIKAEITDSKAELTDVKAEIVDIADQLDFKIDFELEQALLSCGCTPSLYLPDPAGKLDRALNLVNTGIDLVEASLDPDLVNKIPQARCYADEAAQLLSDGSFKKSCLALGSAIRLLDGHPPAGKGSGNLCLVIPSCMGEDEE